MTAQAHRIDELLQTTFIAIEPDQVQLDLMLTPGILMSRDWVSAIDRDQDGQISREEAAQYSEGMTKLLSLEIDGHPCPLQIVERSFPSLEELLGGVGLVRLELRSEFTRLGSGRHSLTFNNGYGAERSVYLVNAVLPTSPAIEVTRQTRDQLQKTAHLEFSFREDAWARAKPEKEGTIAEATRPWSVWLFVVMAGISGVAVAGRVLRHRAPGAAQG